MQFLWFILGSVFGGFVGAAIMACMYYNRSTEYENEIERLRNMLKNKE